VGQHLSEKPPTFVFIFFILQKHWGLSFFSFSFISFLLPPLGGFLFFVFLFLFFLVIFNYYVIKNRRSKI